MAHKTFISFKAEDITYKNAILELPNLDIIDLSLNEPINSQSPEYVLEQIRSKYLAKSTVTIHLIGARSAEVLGLPEQMFIKGELQLSLRNSTANPRNGILGVVLPNMVSSVYMGEIKCTTCGEIHQGVNINANTTVSEFYYNYYIPNDKCYHTEEDRYCVLRAWEDFVADP